jgi:hypothetical protein
VRSKLAEFLEEAEEVGIVDGHCGSTFFIVHSKVAQRIHVRAER